MIIAMLLLGGLIGLVAGGELLVRGSSGLALRLGIPSVVVGLTIVAFGTSAPELAVSVDAALSGQGNIALGNVVGSNLFNFLGILGISGLIAPLVIHSKIIRREAPLLVLTTIALWIMGMDGIISFSEGLILLLGIITYCYWLVRESLTHRSENREIAKDTENEFQKTKHQSLWLLIVFVVVGLGLILLGADYLVDGAVQLAKSLGVSDVVIGLTIVSIGTSLPEVVASVMAALKKETDIAVGNVVGSNIFNSLLIVGASSSISNGITVDSQIQNQDLPFLLGVSLLCGFFFWTGKKLSRGEAATILTLYIGYTTYLILYRT